MMPTSIRHYWLGVVSSGITGWVPHLQRGRVPVLTVEVRWNKPNASWRNTCIKRNWYCSRFFKFRRREGRRGGNTSPFGIYFKSWMTCVASMRCEEKLNAQLFQLIVLLALEMIFLTALQTRMPLNHFLEAFDFLRKLSFDGSELRVTRQMFPRHEHTKPPYHQQHFLGQLGLYFSQWRVCWNENRMAKLRRGMVSKSS